MKLGKLILPILVLIIVGYLVKYPTLIPSQPYVQDKVILDVQRDGTVIVTHILNVTEEVVSLLLPTLAKPLEPIIAMGKDVYATEVRFINNTYYIEVYVPDLGLLNVTYVVDTLTKKVEPNIWVLNVSVQSKIIVILPIDAIPIKIPSFIDLYETDGRYVIVLAPGTYEIDYILKVKVPKFIPQITILSLNLPEKVKSEDKFTLEINVKNIGNASANFFIRVYDKETGNLIANTTVSLDVGESKVVKLAVKAPKVSEDKSWVLVVECGYDNIVNIRKIASILVYAVKPLLPPFWIFIIAIIVVIVIVAILLRKKRESESYVELKPILSDVDYMIIDYLKGKDAVYQSELINALRLPKTTVWRHLKKLEKYGIVRIERYGNVNVVRLVKYISQ